MPDLAISRSRTQARRSASVNDGSWSLMPRCSGVASSSIVPCSTYMPYIALSKQALPDRVTTDRQRGVAPPIDDDAALDDSKLRKIAIRVMVNSLARTVRGIS